MLLRVSEVEKPERDVLDKAENVNFREEDRSLYSEVPSNSQHTTYFKVNFFKIFHTIMYFINYNKFLNKRTIF